MDGPRGVSLNSERAHLTLKAGVRAALQHDAALGLDRAGIAGVAWAGQVTARIGDGRSTCEDGNVSAANAKALALGAVIGEPALEFVAAVAAR